MHQLALALMDGGVKVYGYDAKPNTYTSLCEKSGMIFSNKYDKAFLNVDFCVYTAAIKPTNRYLRALKKLGVPCIDRAEAVGLLATKFKTVIAVAGTHGKSTTASLIYEILSAAGKKVSCHIGADVKNARFCLGDDFLVVEACEYNKSFLSLYPTITVVTNVEAEHMECYKSLFNLRAAFSTFLKRGKMRFVGADKSNKFLLKLNNVEEAQLVTNPTLKPKLTGEYNQKNIALAYKVCLSLGVPTIKIVKAINNFGGIHRRNEFITEYAGAKIYIDYAHHPTEIAAFLSNFNAQFKNNLVVFQPHTYSRTKTFLAEFVHVLSAQKKLIIFKEYPAREKRAAGLSAFDLYCSIKTAQKNAGNYVANNLHYCSSFKAAKKLIAGVDAVAFVGAGDVDKLAYKLKDERATQKC